MVKFAEAFPDAHIVGTLSQELSWSHFVEILPLKQPLEREYYAAICRSERWSVRRLYALLSFAIRLSATKKLLLPTMNLIRSLTELWGEGWDEG